LGSTDKKFVVGLDELPAKPRATVGFVVPMMAFMLIVYAHHFGWPEEEVVSALERRLSHGDDLVGGTPVPTAVPTAIKNSPNTGQLCSVLPEMMTEDAKFALGF
jgi:hypothetical protein